MKLMERARAAARSALALDPVLADAHAVLGAVSARYDFDWVSAEQHYRRAIELNPGTVTPRQGYAANVLCPLGRLDEAVAECSHGAQIDPLSPVVEVTRLWLRALHGQEQDALRELRTIADANPNDMGSRNRLTARCIAPAQA